MSKHGSALFISPGLMMRFWMIMIGNPVKIILQEAHLRAIPCGIAAEIRRRSLGGAMLCSAQ
jgi:hypothetical protein